MQFPRKEKYTYADYLTWPEKVRYELIDGVAYMMSPAPSAGHQRIFREIFRQLANYLIGKSCEVFSAPFDVRLNAEAEDNTVVQPDISVICDPSKLNDRGCKGAPDMVVEILSPATANHDQIIKFNTYRDAGVREYWIVYPEVRNVQVFLLENGKYVGHAYGDTDTIDVAVLEDCKIHLAEVFPPAPPKMKTEGPSL